FESPRVVRRAKGEPAGVGPHWASPNGARGASPSLIRPSELAVVPGAGLVGAEEQHDALLRLAAHRAERLVGQRLAHAGHAAADLGERAQRAFLVVDDLATAAQEDALQLVVGRALLEQE